MQDPLASFVQAQNAEAAAEQPEIVNTPEATPSVTNTEAPIVETPKVEVKPTKPEVEEIIDLDTPDEVVNNNAEFDFTALIKDSGIEAKDREEFITKIKETISKTQEDPYKGIPDNLRKAVEFAKQGGDALQLLKIGQVDYSLVNPIQMYEQSIRSQIKDQAKATEYLESLSPLAKEIEGEKMKQNAIQWQESQENALRQELAAKASQELARKAQNEQRLRETVNKVDNIEGFKVKPGEKEKFINSVLEGSLAKQLFMDDKGEFDYKKMLEVSFLAKNIGAIKKHYGSKVATATKRELVENLTNAELQTTSERAVGNTTPKSDNPMDGWMAQDAAKKAKKA